MENHTQLYEFNVGVFKTGLCVVIASAGVRLVGVVGDHFVSQKSRLKELFRDMMCFGEYGMTVGFGLGFVSCSLSAMIQ